MQKPSRHSPTRFKTQSHFKGEFPEDLRKILRSPGKKRVLNYTLSCGAIIFDRKTFNSLSKSTRNEIIRTARNNGLNVQVTSF